MKFYISNFYYVNEEFVDVSFLPPMARRKLSLLDKLSLCALNQAYQGGDIKLVFASRYGELDRLNKIISQYLDDNEVSPAAFSASVHNSVIGQFSLLKNIKKSYNSLASGENTFSAGLLEAFLSADENDDVLFCYADSYEKNEAAACIISKKLHPDSICCEYLSDNIELSAKSETENFLEFVSKNKDYFAASDGLYALVRC